MEYLKNIFLYDKESPLLFTSLYFWVFFAVLIAGYSFLYKKPVFRNTYLFILSLFFYYKSGGYFFSLLVFSTIVDYSIGQLIYTRNKNISRKLLLACSVIVNIGLLSYFKYSYFFVDFINDFLSWFYLNFGEYYNMQTPVKYEVANLLAKWTNAATGSEFDVSEIILPVGISFYTFQTISYTVDVYRKKIKPVNNILDFGFYVSFFPQLVAGPIVRASEFVPQLYKKYSLSVREFGHALFLILNGLIKKMIISDFISINFVDRVFDSPASFTGFENLMATYGYSIQIYCDFSGYTDIAIGVALLLGFKLPLNFNSPYKAVNITDFWRRWHISLSSWLKDYLYIPLGGNKKGKIRTYINLMITMLLGGLWHGSNWKFMIWGGIHGISLAIHKIWMKIVNKKNNSTAFSRFISIFFTFHLVTFAWLFFRAPNYESVKLMLDSMYNNFGLEVIIDMIISYKIVFSLILIAFVIHWLPQSIKELYRGIFIKTPIFVKLIITIIIVFIIYQFKSSEVQPFIYFQF